MGFIAGRRIGFPAASNPSITSSLPSSGRCFATGSSSFNLPCSTSCIAATEGDGLGHGSDLEDGIGLDVDPEAESRLPNAPL